MRTKSILVLVIFLSVAVSSAFAEVQQIYWTDVYTGLIQRANLDGSGITAVIATGSSEPRDIKVDPAGSKIYWTEWRTEKIMSANLDGSGVQTVRNVGGFGSSGFDIDYTANQIYWSKATGGFYDSIQRANLDGSGVTTLVEFGTGGAVGIALDVAAGKMYWTRTTAGADYIQRADLDGSVMETLINTGKNPWGIALDIEADKMYWTEYLTGTVNRANLSGVGLQTLVTGLTRPHGIALDVTYDKIYWADTTAGKIQCANLDGTQVEDLITGLQSPWGIAIGPIPNIAFNPNPADGAIQVDPNVIFSWSPGNFAADVNGHDVYFGTDYNDVNDANTTATLGVYMGRQDVNFYDPCGLEIETTYYWRIDEVNDTKDDSPWKGNIWSFETIRPAIELSATQFTFFADEGGPNPPDQILTIRNAGVSTLNWTINYDCSWLSVDPNSGGSTGETNDVTLSVDITGLTRGVYECSLTISDPCAANSPKTVTVTLDVLRPVIELSATEFEFFADEEGPNPPDQILTIRNADGGILNWTITYDCGWLLVEPNSGSSTGEANDVTLSVDVAGLTWGVYECSLTISDPCAENNPQIVAVTLEVLRPVIELSATQFTFYADEGGPNPPDQILTIRNAGGRTLNWTITYDCSWLSVEPNSGSSTGEANDVTLSVDIAGLTCGLYECSLTISDPCAVNSPQIVAVTLAYCYWWDYPACWDFAGQCKGDCDGDAYVANLDFLALKASYTKSYPDGAYNPCADFDRDGYVGNLDFLILKANYTQTVGGCTPGDWNQIYKP